MPPYKSIDARMQAWMPTDDVSQRSGASAVDSHLDPGSPWEGSYRAKLVIGDSVIVVLVIGLTCLVRFGAHEITRGGDVIWEAAAVAVAWLLFLSVVGSRDRRVLSAGLNEYKRVMAGSLYAFGTVAIGSYLLRAELSRFYFLVALPVGTVMLLAFRWICRVQLSRSRQHGQNLTPVIVVGSQVRVSRVVAELRRRRDFGLLPTSCCITDSMERSTVGNEARLSRVSLESIPQSVRSGECNSVVVAGESLSPRQLKELAWSLERFHTSIIVVSEIIDAVGPRLIVQEVAGLDLVHVDLPRFTGWTLRAKRAFDIVFSILALVLLSPLFLLIAVAIYVDDPGPIIFRQQRIGVHGRPFIIHKFRSMAVDAEARLEALLNESIGNGPLFKMDDDPRVTRVGRILRKYSLDEFPQFWTVLRGQMSVVGPRPHLEKELNEFPDAGLRRLLIKPGITGLWQVNGRSDLSLEDSIKLDLRYVQNWSLLGDLVIVMKTCKAMLTSKGAY